MVLDYDIFNLDKREQRSSADERIAEELGFSGEDPAHDLQALLTRPAESIHMIAYIEAHVLTHSMRAENDRVPRETVTFEQLPTEILDMIFNCNDDLTDTVLCSLTCRRFWEIGKRHIIRIRDNFITKNTWAGSRIICEAFRGGNDWPPSIPEEEYGSFSLMNDWLDRSGNASNPQSSYRRRLFLLNPSETRILDYLCEDYCMGNRFVLRNLSKRLFVRDEGLKQLNSQLESKGFNDEIWLLAPEPSSCRDGEWAGDKLEIVPAYQHAREVEEAAQSNHAGSSPVDETGSTCEWKDVTEECIRLLKDIWGRYEGNRRLRCEVRGW